MLPSYVTRKTAARLPGVITTEQVTTSPNRSLSTIGAQKL